MDEEQTYTAFLGSKKIAAGPLGVVLPLVKAKFDENPGDLVFIFNDVSGRHIDFDLTGSLSEVMERALPRPPRARPGRPKLGVVSREISLLPRHWEWLEQQPSGASAAIRRLIDHARKQNPDKQRTRLAQEATGQFMTSMAGDLPGYEEALRAMYAGNRAQLEAEIREWPEDIRAHVLRMLSDTL